MKYRPVALARIVATFVTNLLGWLTARRRLPRHVAEEDRIARGEPVKRDATTLLRPSLDDGVRFR
jgi:hypothetical protein